jgi:hypothetical protein
MLCNSNFKKGTLLIAASVVLFSACKRASKDDNYLSNDDDRVGYAADLSRIERVNDDVISLSDQAGILYNATYIGACATVASDTINNPHTLIVRFGSTDCTALDGHTRKGAIIITYTGHYLDLNTVHNISYDNYYIDGNKLTGSAKVTRVDTTVTGDYYYRVQVSDSLNMSPDPLQSQFVVWSGSLTRKWVGGATTNDRNDDVFSVSGSGTLTRPNGHVFTMGISVPLQFNVNCEYAGSGVVNVAGYDGSRVINYGTGNCDQLAQLNIAQHVYQLTLTK